MNVVFWTATLVLAGTLSAFGQETTVSTPTPLSQLLTEAQANNPQLSAADHEARAARHRAAQVTALPDPKVTYQQFSVNVAISRAEAARYGLTVADIQSGCIGHRGREHR